MMTELIIKSHIEEKVFIKSIQLLCHIVVSSNARPITLFKCDVQFRKQSQIKRTNGFLIFYLKSKSSLTFSHNFYLII